LSAQLSDDELVPVVSRGAAVDPSNDLRVLPINRKRLPRTSIHARTIFVNKSQCGYLPA
jgi:hypothetical protein